MGTSDVATVRDDLEGRALCPHSGIRRVRSAATRDRGPQTTPAPGRARRRPDRPTLSPRHPECVEPQADLLARRKDQLRAGERMNAAAGGAQRRTAAVAPFLTSMFRPGRLRILDIGADFVGAGQESPDGEFPLGIGLGGLVGLAFCVYPDICERFLRRLSSTEPVREPPAASVKLTRRFPSLPPPPHFLSVPG